MTHTLTRLFSRTKRKQEPDYLPPYFWHRAGVWYVTLILMSGFTLGVIEVYVGELNPLWNWVAACVVQGGSMGMTRRIRYLWTKRRLVELQPKLDDSDPFEVGEAIVKLDGLTREFERYNSLSGARIFSSFSVRRTLWEGSGTKFTVYERNRKKRVYTFYHD